MMNASLEGWGLWLALAGACLGTYVCRAIGVMLSDRINQDSEIFRLLSAITYAMVATNCFMTLRRAGVWSDETL